MEFRRRKLLSTKSILEKWIVKAHNFHAYKQQICKLALLSVDGMKTGAENEIVGMTAAYAACAQVLLSSCNVRS